MFSVYDINQEQSINGKFASLMFLTTIALTAAHLSESAVSEVSVFSFSFSLLNNLLTNFTKNVVDMSSENSNEC